MSGENALLGALPRVVAPALEPETPAAVDPAVFFEASQAAEPVAVPDIMPRPATQSPSFWRRRAAAAGAVVALVPASLTAGACASPPQEYTPPTPQPSDADAGLGRPQSPYIIPSATQTSPTQSRPPETTAPTSEATGPAVYGPNVEIQTGQRDFDPDCYDVALNKQNASTYVFTVQIKIPDGRFERYSTALVVLNGPDPKYPYRMVITDGLGPVTIPRSWVSSGTVVTTAIIAANSSQGLPKAGVYDVTLPDFRSRTFGCDAVFQYGAGGLKEVDDR